MRWYNKSIYHNIYSSYKAVWRIPKLILLAYTKYLLFEVNILSTGVVHLMTVNIIATHKGSRDCWVRV